MSSRRLDACFDYAIAFGDGSLSTNGWGRVSPNRARSFRDTPIGARGDLCRGTRRGAGRRAHRSGSARHPSMRGEARSGGDRPAALRERTRSGGAREPPPPGDRAPAPPERHPRAQGPVRPAKEGQRSARGLDPAAPESLPRAGIALRRRPSAILAPERPLGRRWNGGASRQALDPAAPESLPRAGIALRRRPSAILARERPFGRRWDGGAPRQALDPGAPESLPRAGIALRRRPRGSPGRADVTGVASRLTPRAREALAREEGSAPRRGAAEGCRRGARGKAARLDTGKGPLTG